MGNPRRRNTSNMRDAIMGKLVSRHTEFQCANAQEVRFNNSSSFLKSALICLYPIRLLPTGELFWPPGPPLALSLSLTTPNGGEYIQIGPVGDSDTSPQRGTVCKELICVWGLQQEQRTAAETKVDGRGLEEGWDTSLPHHLGLLSEGAGWEIQTRADVPSIKAAWPNNTSTAMGQTAAG